MAIPDLVLEENTEPEELNEEKIPKLHGINRSHTKCWLQQTIKKEVKDPKLHAQSESNNAGNYMPTFHISVEDIDS